MTITVDIPEDLLAQLSTLPPETVRQYANNFAVSGLRQVAAKTDAELRQYEESCAAIIESNEQYQRGNSMTLEEAILRFSKERRSNSTSVSVHDVE